MAKQILEIEVPEGKKAVWKNGKVYFMDINSIQTIEEAINYLRNNNMCSSILKSITVLDKDSYEYKVACYRAVVAALTNNESISLTEGDIYYPYVQLCNPGKENNCFGDTIIGTIYNDNKKYSVVGGDASYGSCAGLCPFLASVGVSCASASVGLRGVSSRELAEYISKQFGKLVFEIMFGGNNCTWKWAE